jgi:transposase
MTNSGLTVLSPPDFVLTIVNPSSLHLSCRTSPCPSGGPKCKLGYYRVFNLIVWVLYTGMQWKCLPIPQDAQGKPVIHYTTVYKVIAKWADDGSLWQAFVASVRHLAAEKQLDLSVLHGDGTNTVAKKGGMALGSRGINTRRVTKSSRSSTIMAMSSRLSLWLLSMRPTWSCYRKA